MLDVSLKDVEKNLVDINEGNIPDEVIDFFWEEKEKRGSLPMGISKIEDKWCVVSPSLENYIIKVF